MANILPADAPGFAMTESLQARHIQKLENELLEKSQETMLAVAMFAEVEPPVEGQEAVIPESFHERFGDRAKTMYRVAQMANLPGSEAPVGLKMTQQTLVGITKSRATAKQAPRTLNMTLVQMPSASINYPVKDMDKE